MANPGINIPVPFTGPECPACHEAIVLTATVKIKTATIRTGGSSFHQTDLIADLTNEVTEVTASHTCNPKKRE